MEQRVKSSHLIYLISYREKMKQYVKKAVQNEVLQFEVLKVIELNPKFLTKSTKSRIFDGALEFAEHPIRTRK